MARESDPPGSTPIPKWFLGLVAALAVPIVGADSAVLSRDALGDLYQLVIDVRALEPSARIVLCPLTLTTGNTLREARRQAFNSGLSSVVRALRAQGVPLAVSNSGSALAAGDLFDGLHPNDAGYQALGDAILPQIRYAAGHS